MDPKDRAALALDLAIMPPKARVINIDDAGDIILVVGDEKKRLRVSSVFMSRASSVFAAMFSGTFLEGVHPHTPGSYILG